MALRYGLRNLYGAATLRSRPKSKASILCRSSSVLSCATIEYVRHGTQTLLATLEIATGKIVAHVRDRRTTVDFLSFMNDVVKSYPLGELHVVLDNLNIHKNEAARQWLLRHPRVHFHYTQPMPLG